MTQVTQAAFVQQAEETEQQLVEAAKIAIAKESDCKWKIGQFAHDWTQRHAKGRTDDDFAKLVGLSRVQVTQRRNVFENFGDVCNAYYKLRWSHFNVAIDWLNAEEWLAAADKHNWSVSTMVAKRREANAPEPVLDPDAGQDSDEISDSNTVAAPADSPPSSVPTTLQPSADHLQEITKEILAEKAKTLKVKSLHDMVELAKAFNVVLDNTAKPNIDVKRLIAIREEVTGIFQKAFRDAFGKKTEVAE
jgi:hypothetical protein